MSCKHEDASHVGNACQVKLYWCGTCGAFREGEDREWDEPLRANPPAKTMKTTLEDLSNEQVDKGVKLCIGAIMYSICLAGKDGHVTMPNKMAAVGVNISKLDLLVQSRKRGRSSVHYEVAIAAFLQLLTLAQQALEEAGGRKAVEALEAKILEYTRSDA